MAVENFLENMNALVEELKAHPKVTLLNYYVPAPATEQDFAEVEAHIGFSLPEDIKAFYRQCNGIQLRWVHKDNKHVDQKLWSEFMEGPFDYEEIVIEKGLDGVVYILPLKGCFLGLLPFSKRPLRERELNFEIQLLGNILRFRDLLPRIWHFDLLDISYDFAFFLGDGGTSLIVLQGAEHRRPSLGFPMMSFADYLDWIILKKGVSKARILGLVDRSKSDPNSNVFNISQSIRLLHEPQPYDLSYAIE